MRGDATGGIHARLERFRDVAHPGGVPGDADPPRAGRRENRSGGARRVRDAAAYSTAGGLRRRAQRGPADGPAGPRGGAIGSPTMVVAATRGYTADHGGIRLRRPVVLAASREQQKPAEQEAERAAHVPRPARRRRRSPSVSSCHALLLALRPDARAACPTARQPRGARGASAWASARADLPRGRIARHGRAQPTGRPAL